MLVSVDARINDVPEEVVENVGQTLSSHHSMKSSYEHSFMGFQSLGRILHVVAVTYYPWNDLNLRHVKLRLS